eukprot:scaffold201_cov121-Isochrysis_galbana.AAC.17
MCSSIAFSPGARMLARTRSLAEPPASLGVGGPPDCCVWTGRSTADDASAGALPMTTGFFV